MTMSILLIGGNFKKLVMNWEIDQNLENLVNNHKFRIKFENWSTFGYLGKNWKFGQKLEIWSTTGNFVLNLKHHNCDVCY